jgi:hypothetical protein
LSRSTRAWALAGLCALDDGSGLVEASQPERPASRPALGCALASALGVCAPSLGVVARRGQLDARGVPPGVSAAFTRVGIPAGAAAEAAAAEAAAAEAAAAAVTTCEPGQATIASLP